jgi:hypothetical protein
VYTTTRSVPAKKDLAKHAIRVNVSFDPGDLALLDEIAAKDYAGNRSAAITGLARAARGLPPRGTAAAKPRPKRKKGAT